MIDVVVATGSPGLGQRVAAAVAAPVAVIPAAPLPADLPQLLARVERSTPPLVVVLDCALGVPAALDLAARLSAAPGGPKVVLVSDQGPALALDALRAGVVDIVHPGVAVADLGAVLAQAAAAASGPGATATSVPGPTGAGPAGTGRVISVVSSKGGAGKTTLSTNIAVGLAQLAPSSVVLVDLDVQFGDVASALDLEPEYTLSDAVGGAASRDSLVLKTYLTQHPTGLYVLAAPNLPAEADRVTPADVDRVVGTLAREFAFVVVDTAPGLSEHTLAALDRTTDPVLLTSMDVPSLRGLRKEVDALRELGMLRDSRRLVVNFADPRSGLTVADVEATIGTPVDVVLPRSRAVPASVNLGVPLLQGGAKDKTTKALRQLVAGLAAGQALPRPLPTATTAARPATRLGRMKKPEAAPRRAAQRWPRPDRKAS